jgi:hypothetical protein
LLIRMPMRNNTRSPSYWCVIRDGLADGMRHSLNIGN